MGLTITQEELWSKGKEEQIMAEVKMKKKITDMDASDFPSNSNKSKKKAEPITQALIRQPKKSAGRKISETFLADDAHNVFNYVATEVLIPAAKSLVSDIVRTAIDRLLFGGSAASIRKRHSTPMGAVINYGRFHQPARHDPRDYVEPQRPTIARRVRQSFEDVVLGSRDEAEEVLTNLLEYIDNYGAVSLADFYDLVGVPSTFIDFKHGWDTLNSASIVRVADGYVLNLPRPIQLT